MNLVGEQWLSRFSFDDSADFLIYFFLGILLGFNLKSLFINFVKS